MHERIKELLSQAQKEIWGNNPYNGSPEFEGYELDPEKFAELLIKQCGQLVDNEEYHTNYTAFLMHQFGVK